MRVLIVEDEEVVARTLYYLVTKDGHHADCVGSCKDAREALSSADVYDLVVLDLGLPDGNGLSLAEIIHRRSALTNIVILTGSSSLDDAARAIRSGVTDFLIKPITSPDFHDMLVRTQTRVALRKSPEGERTEQVINLMGDMASRLERVEQELRDLRSHHA